MAGRGRKTDTTAERAAAAEKQAARVTELHTRLVAAVESMTTGQEWRQWLDTAARFHRYSANNTMLIATQRPEATRVAGYRAWQTLGRQVRKGEAGIWILAPVTKKREEANDKDADRKNAEPTGVVQQPAERARQIVGVRGTAVFDVSQTDGDPLPAPPTPELLRGQAPVDLWSDLVKIAGEHGFSVDREPLPAGTNGVTRRDVHRITVRPDIDDAQAVKTLAHETGHVLLHTGDAREQGVIECRGGREVEAESVAYIVMSAHGVAAEGYTFPYVAVWASQIDGYRDDPVAAVRATATRVQTAARTILDVTLPAETVAGSGVALSRAEHGADAAAALAERVSALTEDAATPTDSQQHLDRLAAVNELAAQYFAAAAGRAAGDLAARGIDSSAPGLARFTLGYAPARSTLTAYLRTNGVADDEIAAAGLARRHGEDEHLTDAFRGRLMFGIRDETGRLAGFIGRDAIASNGPKYLNTPATPLFNKGSLLIGAAEQTEQLHSGTRVPVLVEGPVDVLALAQYDGAPAVLGTCGTAVTAEHVELLGRLTPCRTIVLALDGDQAGQKATEAAGARFAAAGWDVRVAADGRDDPAARVQRLGAEALATVDPGRAVELPAFGVDRRIDQWINQLDTPQGRYLASEDIGRYLASYPAGPQIDRIAAESNSKISTLPGAVEGALQDARRAASDAGGRLNDRAASIQSADETGRPAASAATLGLSHPSAVRPTPHRTVGATASMTGESRRLPHPRPTGYER